MSEVNPLLAKTKLPGKILKLPSGGFFYKDEIDPDCDAEVEVKPMSAIAEIAIKSPELLYSGRAIEQVIRECVPQVNKPLNLYSKDIDAILCFLRIVTYGKDLEIIASHTCSGAQNHNYIVDLDKMIGAITYLDPTTFEANYTATLDNGQVVHLRPLTMGAVLRMLQTAKDTVPKLMDGTPSDADAESLQKYLISNMLTIIRDVDGITDVKMIDEWIRTLTTKHVTQIYAKFTSAEHWGVDTTSEFVCLDCKEKFTVEIPINPTNFFAGP